MKRIISLLTAISILMPMAPVIYASEQTSAASVDTAEYKIVEGEQLFFEDFDGEIPDSAYFPSSSFMTEQSTNGTKALHIRGIGQQPIATNCFGPELDNYLVEADIKLSGCGASTNGGFFISARKTSNTSASYNLLYTDVNRYDFSTKSWNSPENVRDRFLITRSKGDANITKGWFWTKMSNKETGLLDSNSRSFADFAHFKFYMSDTFIRCEIYNLAGELITSIQQMTDEVDTVAGNSGDPLARIEKGNIQIGTHLSDVWFDNVSVKRISVIESATVKTSAEVMLTDNEYEVWAESERGVKIPFDMLNWEYDRESLEITDGKIIPKKPGEYTITAKYADTEVSKSFKAQKEYKFSDYEVICERPNVFLGESINISLKGMYEGNEYFVTKDIDITSTAGSYDGKALVTDKSGSHTVKIVYNGIEKTLPVYVSGYTGAEIVLDRENIIVGESCGLAVIAKKGEAQERLLPGSYTITSEDGISISGEDLTTTRTGERKILATVDNVEIEKTVNIGQLSEGVIFSETFEDDYYSEFFNVPRGKVITDTDGNRVYRLYDEFSPYYGDESWYNYKISGRVKIKNRRIEKRRYNTSFGIYLRQSVVTDEAMTGGEKGIPVLYAIDEDFQYLRVGTQSGAGFASENDVWYDFSAECMDSQYIFSMGGKTITYETNVNEKGGFFLNAENTELYLDDIKLERLDGNAPGEITRLEAVNDFMRVDEYATRQIPSLIAVKAYDNNGRYKYVTTKAEYEILSDNAEIISDTLRLEIKPGTKEPIEIGIKFAGLDAKATIVPVSNYPSKTEYLKATQSIRNKNFAYKMLRSVSIGRVLDTSTLYINSYVSALLALQPKRRNYDHVIQWYIDIGKYLASLDPIGADFTANVLIVIMYELRGVLNVSEEMWKKAEDFIASLYYGFKDTPCSENHRVCNYADALLAAELVPDGTFYGGKTAEETWNDFAGYIVDWINYRYKNGMQEYDSTYIGIDLVSFYSIYNYTKNETMRKICKDYLDWLYADVIQDSIEDRISGAHGRTYFNNDIVGKCYWFAQTFENEGGKWDETGASYGVQPGVFSFQQYIPDDIIYEIEQNRSGFVNKERKMIYTIPDYEVSESLCKYTYVAEDYSLGCISNLENPFKPNLVKKGEKFYNSDNIWVLNGHQEFSMSAVIRGNDKRLLVFGHPGPLGYTDYKNKHSYYSGYYNYPCFNYLQDKGTILGVYRVKAEDELPYTHCYIPKATFSKVDEEEGWIFLLADDVYTAIRPLTGGKVLNTPQYRWGDELKFTGSNINLKESEILLEDRHSAFVMHMTSGKETGMSFDEFKAAMKKTSVEYTLDLGGTLTYTKPDGTVLKVVYDTNEDFINGEKQDYSEWKLFDSEFMQSEYGSGYTKIMAGDKDLTVMPVKMSGSKDAVLAIDKRIESLQEELASMGAIAKSERLDKINLPGLVEDIIYAPNEYVQTILWEKLLKAADSFSGYNTGNVKKALEIYTGVEFHGEYVKKLIDKL